MATLSVANPTLMDLAKATNPDQGIADVVEILNQTNPILQDVTFLEGNLPTGHRTTMRAGIPLPAYRKLYGAVQPTKGETVQVDDSCGMLEAYAEVDKALADLNGNTAAFRLMQERAHIEGFNQKVASDLFYANTATVPESFLGFAPRFNDTNADNAENLIDAGGDSTDNGSIWLVVWGPMTCHGIVPKGSTAGLQRSDLGETTKETAAGMYQVYRTHIRWDVGLSVPDWRYVVRIHSIKRSALTSDASSGPSLPDLMFEAMAQIPNLNMGRPAFYMSRREQTFLRQQMAAGVSGSTLQVRDVGGVLTEEFHGIPVRRTDALAADEALV